LWQILDVPDTWPETTAFLESLVSSPSTPGLKPTAPPASPDYDLGFDAQLGYLCNDGQWPASPARRAALAAATESFAPYVGPKWAYIGFPCVGWTTRAPGRYLGPDNEHTIAAGELPLRPGYAALECGRDSACAGRHAADHDRRLGPPLLQRQP
jgi:hypothetical protein